MKELPRSEQELVVRNRLDKLEEVDSSSLCDLIFWLKKNEGINAVGMVESWLREKESEISFLAVPMDELVPTSFESKLFGEDQDHYPYYLFICLSGREGRDEAVDMLGLSKDEKVNLANLNQTGFLLLKPGHELDWEDNSYNLN